VNKTEGSIFDAKIASFLKDRNAGLLGFADLSAITKENRYDFPRSISFCFPIPTDILKQIKSGPTLEYFDEYNRLNVLLEKTAQELEDYIFILGYKALAIDKKSRQYDAKKLTTILPHKTSAILSGSGWIGKCNLFITNEYGSGIRLGTVLTDIPLTTGSSIAESRCGNCLICYERCPGKAITGSNWKTGMGREELYNAFACQKAAKKLSDAIGADHPICGICIANCPWTVSYINRRSG